MLTLTTVPVVSQILGLLLTPIVTRLYAPEVFGLVNIFSSGFMLIAVFSTMGYHGAIILPKTDATASTILVTCFYSTFCISAISLLIVIAGKDIIPAKLNVPGLVKYLWLIPVFVFSHGIHQTLRFWKTRLQHFDILAASRVSEIVVRKSFQIPAGFLGYATAGSLIFADLTKDIVRNLFLLKNMGLKTIILKKNPISNLWPRPKGTENFLCTAYGESFSAACLS